MSQVLQSLIAKLKRRRKSQPRNQKTADLGAEDGQSNALTEQMGELDLSSSVEKSTSRVFGAQDFEFDFAFKSSSTWPGPAYDEASRFAPGIFDKPRVPKRKAIPKRRLSQEEKSACPQSKERSVSTTMKTVVKQATRPRKISRGPNYFGPAPTRDPPLHLLNLPAEIRNQIYRNLYLSSEPIKAQIRPVVRPRRVPRGPKKDPGPIQRPHDVAIRRLPREPTLALVSQQLRNEVLNLFYSENKFIFIRSENNKLENWIMTHEKNLKLWAPKLGFADSLRHIEVHFSIGIRDYIIYNFQKLADGKIEFFSNTHYKEYCVCFDRELLQMLKTTMNWLIFGNLMEAVEKFLNYRKSRLVQDPTMRQVDAHFMNKNRICEKCGRAGRRVLEGGG